MDPPLTPIFIFDTKQRSYAEYILGLFLEKALPARICEVHRDNFLDHVDRCVQDGMRYAVMVKPSHEKEKKVSFRAINLDGESPGVADIPAKVAVDYIIHQAGKGVRASIAGPTDHKRKWEGGQDGPVQPAHPHVTSTVDTGAQMQQMLLLLQQTMGLIQAQAQAQAMLSTPPVQGGATGLQAMLQSAILRQQMSSGQEVPQSEQPQPQAQTTASKTFNLASILSKLKK
eukprot:GGOE01013808.1.p1 GENE.GGOE01013808.1~~GGOE01013808.1.p1  ORF type:complete len:229 (-),score=30.79 GGOE01013808.1:39-725(-)